MCIKSFIKDTSHGFFVSRQVVHNRFMDLSNLEETIVHHLLIGGMVSLVRKNWFLMVSALAHVMHTR